MSKHVRALAIGIFFSSVFLRVLNIQMITIDLVLIVISGFVFILSFIWPALEDELISFFNKRVFKVEQDMVVFDDVVKTKESVNRRKPLSDHSFWIN